MKQIKNILLGTALLSASLFAEIHFDLNSQHFSKAIEGNFEGARYELPSAYVSTNLKYANGYYITQNSSGYMNVELKTAVSDWSVSIDTYYQTSSAYQSFRSIKLTADNGESIVISTQRNAIIFNGESVYNPDENGIRMTFSITKTGDSVDLSINGAKVPTIQRANFLKLKHVEVQAIQENSANDRVNSVIIGSN